MKQGHVLSLVGTLEAVICNHRTPTIAFTGIITKNDLQGPLKGKEASDLVSLMSNGSAYVNAHTDKYPRALYVVR